MSNLIYRFKFAWWMWRLSRGRCGHCGHRVSMSILVALRYPIPDHNDRETPLDDVRTEISYAAEG